MRQFVIERIERLRAEGGGDIVVDLFKPLPSMVVAHYLGVPEEDRAQFDGWTEAIVAANAQSGGFAEAAESAGEAVASMMAYFTELIERRRREPGDDTVSHLVAAGVGADGDMAGMLSVLAFTFTMVTGGNDTTTGMLGGTVQLLHQRPDQRRLLVNNPELIDRRDRRAAATHLARAGAGPHHDPRCQDRQHHHPRRAQGAAALRVGQPRRARVRRRRRRTRGAQAAAQHFDVQPRRALLPRRGRGTHAIARRAHRTAGPLPRVRGRRVRDRLGRWQLRASTAVGPVPGDRVMAGNDWLGARRTEVAADRILDAADALFAQQDAATVGMHEIAKAAGCSRATLYRYFENREALYTAYVHRESYRLFHQMTEQLSGVDEPRERLIEGMVSSLRNVRQSPALSSWFATAQRPIGAEIAEQSQVIKALTEAFLISMAPDDPEVVERKARWLVRVMTSLLVFPGHDEADERAMIEQFVVPMVVPTPQEPTG